MSPPTSSDDDLGKNPFRERNHQLPDGSWVSLRIKCDSLRSEWTYFWITFVTGKVRPTWYRVFPAGTPPPQWRLMKSAGAVDPELGPGAAESEHDAQEIRRENKGRIGARKRLQPGRYVVQSKIRVGEEEIELTSVEFEVSRGPLGPLGAGWG
jgi:hypothetical protein